MMRLLRAHNFDIIHAYFTQDKYVIQPHVRIHARIRCMLIGGVRKRWVKEGLLINNNTTRVVDLDVYSDCTRVQLRSCSTRVYTFEHVLSC